MLYHEEKYSRFPYDNVYELINPEDSKYIDFIWEHGTNALSYKYFFKSDIPDDIYQIYIDDRIVSETSYRNGLRNGKHTRFHRDGRILSTEWYNNDVRYGEYHKWNTNDILVEYKYLDTLNSMIYSIFYHHNNGILDRYEIMFKNSFLFREVFDENGRIDHDGYSSYDDKLKSSHHNYKDGRLHGKSLIEYESGRFEFIYEHSKILEWKYYDNEKQKYIINYPQDIEGLPK